MDAEERPALTEDVIWRAGVPEPQAVPLLTNGGIIQALVNTVATLVCAASADDTAPRPDGTVETASSVLRYLAAGGRHDSIEFSKLKEGRYTSLARSHQRSLYRAIKERTPLSGTGNENAPIGAVAARKTTQLKGGLKVWAAAAIQEPNVDVRLVRVLEELRAWICEGEEKEQRLALTVEWLKSQRNSATSTAVSDVSSPSGSSSGDQSSDDETRGEGPMLDGADPAAMSSTTKSANQADHDGASLPKSSGSSKRPRQRGSQWEPEPDSDTEPEPQSQSQTSLELDPVGPSWAKFTYQGRVFYQNQGTIPPINSLIAPEEGVKGEQEMSESQSAVFERCFIVAGKMDSGELNPQSQWAKFTYQGRAYYQNYHRKRDTQSMLMLEAPAEGVASNVEMSESQAADFDEAFGEVLGISILGDASDQQSVHEVEDQAETHGGTTVEFDPDDKDVPMIVPSMQANLNLGKDQVTQFCAGKIDPLALTANEERLKLMLNPMEHIQQPSMVLLPVREQGEGQSQPEVVTYQTNAQRIRLISEDQRIHPMGSPSPFIVQQVAPTDAECFICREGGDDEPLLRGCACRSSWVHLSCLAEFAGVQKRNWSHCSTCNTLWVGAVQLGMAQRHWDAVCERDGTDRERSQACRELAGAMDEVNQDQEGALHLLEQLLLGERLALGNDSPPVVLLLSEIATMQLKLGNFQDAVTLLDREVLPRCRDFDHQCSPEGSRTTIDTLERLSIAHKMLGNGEKAIPLMRQAVLMSAKLVEQDESGKPRASGEPISQLKVDALNSKAKLGELLVWSVGDMVKEYVQNEQLDESLTDGLGEMVSERLEPGHKMFREALDELETVLGASHPQTRELRAKLVRLDTLVSQIRPLIPIFEALGASAGFTGWSEEPEPEPEPAEQAGGGLTEEEEEEQIEELRWSTTDPVEAILMMRSWMKAQPDYPGNSVAQASAAQDQPGMSAQQGLVCHICQEGQENGQLLSKGCGCRGSAEFAHLECLVEYAKHEDGENDVWTECNECALRYTGVMASRLARARWKLVEHAGGQLAFFEERMIALGDLAGVLRDEGDLEGARVRFDELLEVQRRAYGDVSEGTLCTLNNLARVISQITEQEFGRGVPLGQIGIGYMAATVLAKEALEGWTKLYGPTHETTVQAMTDLAQVYCRSGLQNAAAARPLYEDAVKLQRQSQPDQVNTIVNVLNLGNSIVMCGDKQRGLELMDEAVAIARRRLGTAHAQTQDLAAKAAKSRNEGSPCNVRAEGTLIGLTSRPELNNRRAAVVGFDFSKGRYQVVLGHTPAYGTTRQKQMAIKPANLMLIPGSAVVIENLQASPEWNGTRGLIHSEDPPDPSKVSVHDRYKVNVKRKERPLGLRRECCRLEWVVEQERAEVERQRVADRRAEVEANVAAALAARETAS